MKLQIILLILMIPVILCSQAIVTIPDTVGMKDSTIFIPLKIDLKTYKVVCYEFEVNFSPDVIVALGASKDSTLSENWSGPYVNTNFIGKMKVAGLFVPNINQESDSICGTGNLVNLMFKVMGNENDSTAIEFSYFKFHADYPPVMKQGGSLKVVSEIPSGVERKNLVHPESMVLYPNYPDPFKETTVIEYQLLKSQYVTVRIYNLLGQEVVTLANTTQKPQAYSLKWNGRDDNGCFVPSGLYFCVIRTSTSILAEKITFMK